MTSANNRHLDDTSEALKDVGKLDLNRYPLIYLPRSTTQVNSERLPKRREMADMELACREQFADDDTVLAEAAQSLQSTLFNGLLLFVLGLLFAALVPIGVVFGLVGIFAALCLPYLAIRERGFSSRVLLKCVALSFRLLSLLLLSHLVFHYRLVGTLALMIAACFWLRRYGGMPITFYVEWLYTHPQLTPDTRRHRLEPGAPINRSLLLFLAAIVLLVPVISPWLASGLVIGVCAYTCRRDQFGLKLVSGAQEVLGKFLAYGLAASEAPGTWMPEMSLAQRRKAMLAITAAIFAPLTLGLCYYFPCRITADSLGMIPVGANGDTHWEATQRPGTIRT